MITAAIVVCEVAFWVVLLAGLLARYPLRRPRLGGVLIACAPLVDVALLVFTLVDLGQGGEASVAHALAAVYIGVSVSFGHALIGWADERFAHRYADGPAPVRAPRIGPAHAAHQRKQWLRHLQAWAIGTGLLALGIVLVGDASRTAALEQVAVTWTVVLALDFLVSFSYSLAPRRPVG